MGAKKGQTRKSVADGRQRLALVVFGLLLAGLFLGFAITQGISGPSVPSDAAAVVEDVPAEISTVTDEDFKLALLQQAAGEGIKKLPKPGEKKYEDLKKAALEAQLDMIWIQGEAEELGIGVTDKQIETELEQIKKQNFKSEAEYEKFVKTARLSEDEVLERVKLQILTEQIQQQVSGLASPATDEEIEDYYKAELATQFTEPTTLEARIIVNEDEAKVEDAKAQLEKDSTPASWKELAAKFSEDPNTKSTGGLQAGLTEELLQSQPELSAALFESDPGEIVGPTPVAGKFFVTEVVKIKQSSTQKLKEVRAQIKSQLDQQLQQEFLGEFAVDFQGKWESRTFCSQEFVELVPKCSNYVGTGHPSGAPEACYEADPKGGRPPDCPAPVQQAAPAIPGSVTKTNPQGERLPQRPRPEGLEESEVPEVGLPGGAVPPPVAE